MKNVKNYSRKQLNEIINGYLLARIPTDSEIWEEWQILTENDRDRVNFVFSCYNSEYNYPQNKQRYPNDQERLAQWFMGLPSSINIDFENYRIIDLAKEWGALPENATEGQEARIIDNWFIYIAAKLISLHNSLNKVPRKK